MPGHARERLKPSHLEAEAILRLAQARSQGSREELGIAIYAELHTAAQGTARLRGGARAAAD
eukprot:2543445-Alexandrium_andersonii.AAC.1